MVASGLRGKSPRFRLHDLVKRGPILRQPAADPARDLDHPLGAGDPAEDDHLSTGHGPLRTAVRRPRALSPFSRRRAARLLTVWLEVCRTIRSNPARSAAGSRWPGPAPMPAKPQNATVRTAISTAAPWSARPTELRRPALRSRALSDCRARQRAVMRYRAPRAKSHSIVKWPF